MNDVTGPLITGSGRSHSAPEMIEAAREVAGRAIGGEHVPAARGEMPAGVIDIDRVCGS